MNNNAHLSIFIFNYKNQNQNFIVDNHHINLFARTMINIYNFGIKQVHSNLKTQLIITYCLTTVDSKN